MNFIEAYKVMKDGKKVISSNGMIMKMENDILKYLDNDFWHFSHHSFYNLMKWSYEIYDDSFEKAGRKYMEFKVGDIVKHKDTGDFDEVIKVNNDERKLTVQYYCTVNEAMDTVTYNMDKAELICPVENRVDKEV
jgi:hypothetical protein